MTTNTTKRTKLIIHYDRPEVLASQLQQYVDNGGLWNTEEEIKARGIPGEVAVIDYSLQPKEYRNSFLECTRRSFPHARYVLINMEKNAAGRLSYQIQEL